MLGWLRGRLFEGLTRSEREVARPGAAQSGVVVDCAVYQRGARRPGPVHYGEAARQAYRHRDAFAWVGLHEPDASFMRSIARAFELHDLTIEQAVVGGHRPAAETIGEVTRLVLRTARYVDHDELTATSEVVDTGDVTVLIGPRFVITVRHGAAGALGPVREELEDRPALLTEGPWAVAYAVCDRMVDLYLDVAGHVERDLERVEEEAFATDRVAEIAHIYQLKREMVEFKRAVLPLPEPFARLLDSGRVPPGLRPYFDDVRGRLARAVERVAGFDDLVNSILQARLAQVSVDQNNDMRKIASWAAIAAVPTVVAGVFGMNFDVIPGAHWRYGFPAAALLMVAAGLLVYWRLKKAGWL
jgi:magnesium transporter